jgi:ADP-heptose:LPS heptosyltransferase
MRTPEYLLIVPIRETLPSGTVLEEGTFLVEKINAAGMLAESEHAEIHPIMGDIYKAPPVLPGENVLIVRPGGYGDLLFCTPLCRSLKSMGCDVTVACFSEYGAILEQNPDVDEIIPYPVPLETWMEFDRHVWLEHVIERGVSNIAETYTTHAIDLIAAAAHVEVYDKSMRYDVTPEELRWALDTYPKTDRRVAIQLNASALNRSYPWSHLQTMAGLIAMDGHEVMLMGLPGMLKGCDTPFRNLTADGLTFRQSCAVLATCDAAVTPDSALCHVAGALGIPTVALYGPFLSQTRTAYSPSVIALNGKADCAPCTHHSSASQPWPAGCPGWKTGRCAALENIPPALVAAQVNHMIESAEKVV